MSEEPPETPDAEQVGSAADEAAKLFAALGDWAKEHGGAEHLATGAPECDVCPICRTVHVVRTASPEVKAHLTSAAASLLQAAASVLDAAGRAPSNGRGGPSVEKIDLEDSQGDEWEDED